ncbi:hypothetical protein YC2023_077321 [Brassica napus]
MAGYSSTAVYKEWKLSKSQGLYVIFAKNDQDSGLVSNCVWVSLFVEGRCSCGYSIMLKLSRFKFEVKLQRRMVHDEFLQVLVKLRSSGGSDQGQKKDHNGACSSKDCFYINGSRLLCLMLFFSGSKVIKQMGFCGAKEKKQVSGFMAQGKESKEFVLPVAVLLNMESTSSRLKHSRQQSLKDVGFRGYEKKLLEHGQFGGSEIRLGSLEEAATLGGYDISDYGGAMLSFQSYISGLLQCEKISEVLWMSFQEKQRFSLVLCSKKSKREPVSVSRFEAQQGIHMDQEEQFKVELFESITKLNKFREFSKSSYKEINSKCCWYCHKRVQEGLSYGENRVLGKVWNMQGICIPGCGGVMQVRELQVSTTESVSGIVTGFGLSRDLYIESLLNQVELGGVFCWSKQRCRVMESAKGRSMKKFGMTKGCEVLRKALKKTCVLIEDWELSRLELGLQGSKEQRQESLQEYEAEKVISQDIARRCRGCRKVQGVAEVEQVCLITGEKLKRR